PDEPRQRLLPGRAPPQAGPARERRVRPGGRGGRPEGEGARLQQRRGQLDRGCRAHGDAHARGREATRLAPQQRRRREVAGGGLLLPAPPPAPRQDPPPRPPPPPPP